MNQYLSSFGPIVLLIVVWVIFMVGYGRRQQKTTDMLKSNQALLERLVAATERIAASVESAVRKQ